MSRKPGVAMRGALAVLSLAWASCDSCSSSFSRATKGAASVSDKGVNVTSGCTKFHFHLHVQSRLGRHISQTSLLINTGSVGNAIVEYDITLCP